jgi:hypothetical protein
MKIIYKISQELYRAAERREHQRALREMVRLAELCRMRQQMVRSQSLKEALA